MITFIGVKAIISILPVHEIDTFEQIILGDFYGYEFNKFVCSGLHEELRVREEKKENREREREREGLMESILLKLSNTLFLHGENIWLRVMS